jgi:hypothetical protein
MHELMGRIAAALRLLDANAEVSKTVTKGFWFANRNFLFSVSRCRACAALAHI